MSNTVKKHHEPLLHIAKRVDMAGWKAWLIRFGAIFIGFFAMSRNADALIAQLQCGNSCKKPLFCFACLWPLPLLLR